MSVEGGDLAVTDRAAYDELNALCRRHPQIFSANTSPGPDELDGFYPAFMETTYVRGLLASGDLQKAIGRLERQFSKTINLRAPTPWSTASDSVRRALQAQKRRERKVRFIHRLAKIFGPTDCPQEMPLVRDQAPRWREAAKALQKAHKALGPLMRDDYFKESLDSLATVQKIMRMYEDLPGVIESLDSFRPNYPVSRNRSEVHTNARQLINRLTDACCRIYGACDQKTIDFLVGQEWLEYVVESYGPNEIKSIMVEAVERKIGLYQRRLPAEPNDPQCDLMGEWLPASTVEPPWMEA